MEIYICAINYQPFILNERNIYRPQRSSGKVIFSQACVIPFTGGGGLVPGDGVSNFSEGGSPTIFQGEGLQNFFFFFFSSFFFPKTILLGCTNPPSRDGQCAGGTHLTGMHSCTIINSTIDQIPLQTKMSQHPPRLPVNNDSSTSVDVLTSVKLVPSRAE